MKNFRCLHIVTVVGLIAAAAFVCLAIAVTQNTTTAFDNSIRILIHSYSSESLTWFFLIVSYTGKLLFLFGLGILVTIIFLYLKRYRWLAVFLITMAGEIALEMGSKAVIARTRPQPFFGLPPAESLSFPSGHALGSFCFYGVIAWLVTSGASIRTRAIVVVLAGTWILLIGVARVYLGMHYPADVLGGYLLGLAWLAVVIGIHEKTKKAA